MAIYHLSAKIISRKSGRSSTAAAAYRAAVEIEDQRTGEVHDYTRKRGVEATDILLPDDAPAWAADRSALWNAVEAKNKRADAQVAREIVVALPDELSPQQRGLLVLLFAQEIAQTYRVAVDLAIHRPGTGGDDRNHHAHLLLTTNRLGPAGFGNKVREFDGIAAARGTDRGNGNAVERLRERWAELTNAALERAGRSERVDHRSLKAQGIEDREPTRHLGPGATAIERQHGEPSRRREAHQAETAARVAAVRELEELERQGVAVTAAIQRAELEGGDWGQIAEALREFEANKIAREQAAATEREARATMPFAAPIRELAESETKTTESASAAPTPRPATVGERVRARREQQRRHLQRTVMQTTAPGTAEATAIGWTVLYRKLLETRIQRADGRIQAARERLEEREREWVKATPSGFLRLSGRYKTALVAHQAQGAALARRKRDLARRADAVDLYREPERIQEWTAAKLQRELPELVDLAAREKAQRSAAQQAETERRTLERQAKALERADRGRGPGHGRGGRSR